MNIEKQKCIRIKKLVETISKVSDIGKRTRKKPFPEYKKIYAKLCLQFTKSSLQVIGDVLGGAKPYDHATIIHAHDSFNDLFSTNGLDLPDIYKKAVIQLNKEKDLFKELDNEEIPLSLFKLNQSNRIKLFKIITKSHSIINKQQQQINFYKNKFEELLQEKLNN